MRRPKVLLADDFGPILLSLTVVLSEEFEIVGTVSDGQALVAAAHRLQPDVIVADMSMPLMSGPEALDELRADGIRVPVIFLTAHPDPTLATEMIRLGAAGFVLKHSCGDELATAIREVLQDRVYLSPLLAGRP